RLLSLANVRTRLLPLLHLPNVVMASVLAYEGFVRDRLSAAASDADDEGDAGAADLDSDADGASPLYPPVYYADVAVFAVGYFLLLLFILAARHAVARTLRLYASSTDLNTAAGVDSSSPIRKTSTGDQKSPTSPSKPVNLLAQSAFAAKEKRDGLADVSGERRTSPVGVDATMLLDQENPDHMPSGSGGPLPAPTETAVANSISLHSGDAARMASSETASSDAYASIATRSTLLQPSPLLVYNSSTLSASSARSSSPAPASFQVAGAQEKSAASGSGASGGGGGGGGGIALLAGAPARMLKGLVEKGKNVGTEMKRLTTKSSFLPSENASASSSALRPDLLLAAPASLADTVAVPSAGSRRLLATARLPGSTPTDGSGSADTRISRTTRSARTARPRMLREVEIFSEDEAITRNPSSTTRVNVAEGTLDDDDEPHMRITRRWLGTARTRSSRQEEAAAAASAAPPSRTTSMLSKVRRSRSMEFRKSRSKSRAGKRAAAAGRLNRAGATDSDRDDPREQKEASSPTRRPAAAAQTEARRIVIAPLAYADDTAATTWTGNGLVHLRLPLAGGGEDEADVDADADAAGFDDAVDDGESDSEDNDGEGDVGSPPDRVELLPTISGDDDEVLNARGLGARPDTTESTSSLAPPSLLKRSLSDLWRHRSAADRERPAPSSHLHPSFTPHDPNAAPRSSDAAANVSGEIDQARMAALLAARTPASAAAPSNASTSRSGSDPMAVAAAAAAAVTSAADAPAPSAATRGTLAARLESLLPTVRVLEEAAGGTAVAAALKPLAARLEAAADRVAGALLGADADPGGDAVEAVLALLLRGNTAAEGQVGADLESGQQEQQQQQQLRPAAARAAARGIKGLERAAAAREAWATSAPARFAAATSRLRPTAAAVDALLKAADKARYGASVGEAHARDAEDGLAAFLARVAALQDRLAATTVAGDAAPVAPAPPASATTATTAVAAADNHHRAVAAESLLDATVVTATTGGGRDVGPASRAVAVAAAPGGSSGGGGDSGGGALLGRRPSSVVRA
ncbi:hypothetical protein HK405_000270, partial [Cladochytrium tenue]